MIAIDDFIEGFSKVFIAQKDWQPWKITINLQSIIQDLILQLDNEFDLQDGVAIHKTAIVEKGAILKAPIIISKNCFIGSNAYLRGGVYLGNNSSIGPNCEVKASIIFNDTRITHFNFIGDSLIGNYINFEAGSITANYYNEKEDKNIFVFYNSKILDANSIKFGSLVGDNAKIGANAVLSPGTILLPNAIVKRLELIDQIIK